MKYLACCPRWWSSLLALRLMLSDRLWKHKWILSFYVTEKGKIVLGDFISNVLNHMVLSHFYNADVELCKRELSIFLPSLALPEKRTHHASGWTPPPRGRSLLPAITFALLGNGQSALMERLCLVPGMKARVVSWVNHTNYYQLNASTVFTFSPQSHRNN